MPKGETDRAVIFRPRQHVRLIPDGAFARVLGTTEIVVNSLHGQCIEEPGERILLEGLAEDGTPEAISVTDAPGFALGVQWHAEWEPGGRPRQRPALARLRRGRAGRGRRAAAFHPSADVPAIELSTLVASQARPQAGREIAQELRVELRAGREGRAERVERRRAGRRPLGDGLDQRRRELRLGEDAGGAGPRSESRISAIRAGPGGAASPAAIAPAASRPKRCSK